MTVLKPLPFALALALLFLFADAAFAQAAAPSSSSFNISWSALDPGDDWTWRMLQSVFPVSGAPPTATGTAATVIGTLLGQITGLVMAIAMFFLCYLTIINIHRVAEFGADHDKRHDLICRGQDRIRRNHDVSAVVRLLGRASGRDAGRGLGHRHGAVPLRQRRQGDRPRRHGDRRSRHSRHPHHRPRPA